MDIRKLLSAIIMVSAFCITLNLPTKAEDDIYAQIFLTQGQYSISNFVAAQQKTNELAAKLNLTDEQKQKAQLIAIESTKKVNEVLFRLTEIREKRALLELKKGPVSNSQQLVNSKDFLRKSRASMKAIRDENMIKFEAILTDKQKADFARFKNEFNAIAF